MTVNPAFRFLIVDDFSAMRRIVRGLLKEAGFMEADEAEDGQSALQKLASTRFDIVITDISMPNMNGFELLEAMQADEKLRDIPVIMITAEAKREDVLRAAEAGVAGYIVKPFSKGTLEDKIGRVMKKLERASSRT